MRYQSVIFSCLCSFSAPTLHHDTPWSKEIAMNTKQTDSIAQTILHDLPAAGASQLVRSISLGSHLAAVRLSPDNGTPGPGLGLASRVDPGHGRAFARELDPAALAEETGLDAAQGLSAQALARLLLEPAAKPKDIATDDSAHRLLHRSLALAAVNALLPLPDAQARVTTMKGQELLLQRGKGRRVVVVGHFPFVEKIAGNFASFHVLERRPRPGDLPAEESARVLPEADVAAITSTSISNGTLEGLLDLCSERCFVLLLGPSTPLAPSLFKLGVDALAGAALQHPEALEDVLQGVRDGHPYKSLPGMRPLLWLKE